MTKEELKQKAEGESKTVGVGMGENHLYKQQQKKKEGKNKKRVRPLSHRKIEPKKGYKEVERDEKSRGEKK